MNKKFFARGKREDTKAWVEGYLIEQNSPEYHAYIIQSFKAEIDNRHIDILECDIYEVIPETVGQFTGLRDKNGTRIFEGDIIKYGEVAYEVTFEQRHNAAYFGLVFSHTETIAFNDYFDLSRAEIIGNIYDSSKLLSCTDIPIPSDLLQPLLQSTTPENFELMNG